jgi:hypothetical protein
MDLAVDGNFTAGGLVVVTYNHGQLVIAGDLRAKSKLCSPGRIFCGRNSAHFARSIHGCKAAIASGAAYIFIALCPTPGTSTSRQLKVQFRDLARPSASA